MGEWERCEEAVKERLGPGVKPVILRRAILNYAVERMGTQDNEVSRVLGEHKRWSWERLRDAGRVIAYRSRSHDLPNPEEGIGNALIALVSYYRASHQKRKRTNYEKRKRDEWRNFLHCSLCWRFIPYARRGSQRVLCSHHVARSPEYQKHIRCEERAQEIYRSQNELAIDDPARNPPESPRDWLKAHYPYTYRLLNTEAVDMSAWLPVLEFLDDNRDPYGERKALHRQMVAEREELLSIVSWAEAWLKALDENKPGGKRENAGRPRSKSTKSTASNSRNT